MSEYKLTLLPDGVVVIDEDGIAFRTNEAVLLDDIEHLKENQRVFTNQDYYEHTLKMLEEALKLLQKEEMA